MFLAQIAAPGAIEGWLLSAAAVLVMAERGFSFFKNHLREEPPPGQTYMTKDACARIHGTRDDELEEIKDQLRSMQGNRLTDWQKWTDHLNSMRAETGASLTRIHIRLDAMPKDILDLIKKN